MRITKDNRRGLEACSEACWLQNLSPDVLHWIVLEVVHFVVEPSATAKADSQGGHVADHREAPELEVEAGSPLRDLP